MELLLGCSFVLFVVVFGLVCTSLWGRFVAFCVWCLRCLCVVLVVELYLCGYTSFASFCIDWLLGSKCDGVFLAGFHLLAWFQRGWRGQSRLYEG